MMEDQVANSLYTPKKDKTYTHKLPTHGPRDLAKQALSITDSILSVVKDATTPLSLGEIYEAAGFKFKRDQMSSKLIKLVDTGLLERERINGLWRYSIPEAKPENSERNEMKDELSEAQETKSIDPLINTIKLEGQKKIKDAELHADRLRALAAWPALHADVALWLKSLASKLEDAA